MRTVYTKISGAKASAVALATALVLVGWSAGASAQVAQSDYTAGYVVLPKVIVHTTGGTPAVMPGEEATDTLIQITNTNQAEQITVDCWWVNANKHCGTDQGPICETNADCPIGLQCVQGWAVADFQIILTPGQPIGFAASSGIPVGEMPCDPGFPGPNCQTDAGGSVREVPEDPFRGELKCVQVDENDVPVLANDLKIEATVISTTVGGGVATLAAAYNGVGFTAESIASVPPAAGDPLCLGSLPPGTPPSVECAATYAPCPGILHFEHFFENAVTELGSRVHTDLTLVPCSEDLGEPEDQANLSVTAQMLVYNEFEQRFSTNSRVQCYQATRLSDIDTQPGPSGDAFSIFNVGVQGTITGQTRIRGVRGPDGELGYGLLGVGCEDHAAAAGGQTLATAAFNLQHVGFRAEGDAVYTTQFPPGPPVGP